MRQRSEWPRFYIGFCHGKNNPSDKTLADRRMTKMKVFTIDCSERSLLSKSSRIIKRGCFLVGAGREAGVPSACKNKCRNRLNQFEKKKNWSLPRMDRWRYSFYGVTALVNTPWWVRFGNQVAGGRGMIHGLFVSPLLLAPWGMVNYIHTYLYIRRLPVQYSIKKISKIQIS